MPTSSIVTPPRRSVTRFFLLAFGITWALQVPGVLAQRGLLPGSIEAYLPFVMLGIFGPLGAATWLTGREGGLPAVRELYVKLLHWRLPVRYYLVALVLPAVLLTLVLCLLRMTGRAGPVLYLPDAEQLLVAGIVALAEEVGWRGYALPRLQEKMGPFAASGLLGVLWTLWHIPMFLGLGIPLSLLLVLLLYFTGGSLLFTWLFNRSGGSLLLAALAHFGAHLNNSHTALPDDAVPLVVHAILFAAIGLALLRPEANRRTHRPSGLRPRWIG